jgi:hypothetical protein
VENRDGRKIRSLEAANQLHPNQWIHVAVVYDYDNARLRIFRDGKVCFCCLLFLVSKEEQFSLGFLL